MFVAIKAFSHLQTAGQLVRSGVARLLESPLIKTKPVLCNGRRLSAYDGESECRRET